MPSFVLPEFDPESVPIERVPQVVGAFAAWQIALVARQMAAPVTVGEPATEAEDRLLTVQECAARLRKSTKWVYRRVKTLPFARKLDNRAWVFSERGLERWLAFKRA
jgi:predicted DNA-binding transcriptional regulator AlpA